MTLHESELAGAVLRICADRGIEPAETLYEPPLTRREFYRAQIEDRIHRRWQGRYDDAQPDPRVDGWIQRHIGDPEANPAMILSGITGSGKTHNAVAGLRLIAHHHAEQGRGLNWAATTHPDMGHQLRPKADDSHEHALDVYLNADLLILDDLGAGMVTAWTTDCIQRLIDHRWVRRMPSIYTTNLTPDALRLAVEDRVYSRLGDATRIVLSGTDRRWTK